METDDKPNPKHKLTAYIPKPLHRRLRRLSADTDRSVSDVVVGVLEDALPALEAEAAKALGDPS